MSETSANLGILLLALSIRKELVVVWALAAGLEPAVAQIQLFRLEDREDAALSAP